MSKKRVHSVDFIPFNKNLDIPEGRYVVITSKLRKGLFGQPIFKKNCFCTNVRRIGGKTVVDVSGQTVELISTTRFEETN